MGLEQSVGGMKAKACEEEEGERRKLLRLRTANRFTCVSLRILHDILQACGPC